MRRTRCIFCGDNRLSAEHVFGRRWIERLSPDASSHTQELMRRISSTAPELRRSYKTRRPEGMVVHGAVCAECNNGWMNDLDLRAQPLLEAILDRTCPIISAEERRLLATWACKIALVMYAGTGDTTLPDNVFSRFASQPQPISPGLVLLAAQAEIGGETRQTAVALYSGREQQEMAAAFAATFRIQQLVIQVRIPLRSGVSADVRREDLEIVAQLWPDCGAITWPARRQIEDEDAFLRFAFLGSGKSETSAAVSSASD